MRIKNILLLVWSCVLLGLCSCKKEEVMPAPIGQPIPYVPEATRDWQTVMNDAEFSTFKTAYNKSTIASLIKKSNSAFHTVFMPTNKAFDADGWTIDKINAANSSTLDALLAYCFVSGTYSETTLRLYMHRSYPLNTLLTREDLPGDLNGNPYTYRLYVGTWQDSLMVNGVPINKWDRREAALNGYVYKLDKWMSKPIDMTVLEYMESQPRFSMLLDAINASPPYYASEGAWSNDPMFMDILGFTGYGRNTYYLPTNKAFANSGFHSLQDINDRIEASFPIGEPYYDNNQFYRYPRTAMDSILMPHGFSLYGNQYDAVFFLKDIMTYPQPLTGFVTTPGSAYGNPNVVVETSFKVQDNWLQVAGFISKENYQPVKEGDIFCLNGVIHVVDDHLMKP